MTKKEAASLKVGDVVQFKSPYLQGLNSTITKLDPIRSDGHRWFEYMNSQGRLCSALSTRAILVSKATKTTKRETVPSIPNIPDETTEIEQKPLTVEALIKLLRQLPGDMLVCRANDSGGYDDIATAFVGDVVLVPGHECSERAFILD